MWQDCQQHFPKKSRFTLGAKIDTVFIDTIEYVFIAGMLPREKKLLYVERAVVKFDLLKFFFQMAWETKSLDTSKYASLTEPLGNIGKMLGGWQKKLLTETQTPSAKKGFDPMK